MFLVLSRTWVFSLGALFHISPYRPTPTHLVLSSPSGSVTCLSVPSHRARSGATGRQRRRRVTIYTCAVIAAAASPGVAPTAGRRAGSWDGSRTAADLKLQAPTTGGPASAWRMIVMGALFHRRTSLFTHQRHPCTVGRPVRCMEQGDARDSKPSAQQRFLCTRQLMRGVHCVAACAPPCRL